MKVANELPNVETLQHLGETASVFRFSENIILLTRTHEVKQRALARSHFPNL